VGVGSTWLVERGDTLSVQIQFMRWDDCGDAIGLANMPASSPWTLGHWGSRLKLKTSRTCSGANVSLFLGRCRIVLS
jgi:hypothetical protein